VSGVPLLASFVDDCLRFRNENVGFLVFAGGGVNLGGGDDGGVDKSSSCVPSERTTELRRDGLDKMAADDCTLLELTSVSGVPLLASFVDDCLRFRNENVGFLVFAGGGVNLGGGDDGGVDKSSSCVPSERTTELRRDGLDKMAADDSRIAY
jgi:hypothetical protein